MKRFCIPVFVIFLALILCVGMIPVAAQEPQATPAGEIAYGGKWDGETVATGLSGEGSEESPYRISSPEELAWLGASSQTSDYAGKYILLCASLDMGNFNLYVEGASKMIGSSTKPFAGTFDGNGYTVSGVKVSGGKSEGAGLFGYLKGATVRNLRIADSSVGTAYDVNAGGIAAQAVNSTIEGCVVTDTTVTGELYIGGIVGQATGTTIRNCINRADVADGGVSTSAANVIAGGILGYSPDGVGGNTIDYCANYGSVSIKPQKGSILSAGGIIGYITKGDSISYCYNAAEEVSGVASIKIRVTAGGIAGRMRSAKASSGTATIDHCVNLTGTFTATSTSETNNSGLICGFINSGKLTMTDNQSTAVENVELLGGANVEPAVNTGNGIASSPDVSTIRTAIAGSRSFKSHIVGMQKHNTDARKLRFVMSVDSLDYRYAEFRISAVYKTETYYNGYEPIRNVYPQVLVGSGTRTAYDCDGAYLTTMTVENVPIDADVTFTVACYVCRLDGTLVLADQAVFEYPALTSGN